jgi:hypothetical protein
MGDDWIGTWATTMDPTATEVMGGIVYAINSVTDESTVYPMPPDVASRTGGRGILGYALPRLRCGRAVGLP